MWRQRPGRRHPTAPGGVASGVSPRSCHQGGGGGLGGLLGGHGDCGMGGARSMMSGMAIKSKTEAARHRRS